LSKLLLELLVPSRYDPQALTSIVRAVCLQVNQLSEGQITAKYNAQVSVPSGASISYQVGDFIADSNQTVRGSVAPGLAASYVREGWICTSPGTGATATFVEKRVLTGT
jgi:hypothetical protein